MSTTDTTSTTGTTGTADPTGTAGPTGTADVTDTTGARTEAAAETVTESRARIDALDTRILALIEERMGVSAHIQQTRLASGGRRVNLSREMEILGRYRERLGKPGTALAMTLLELSRGRV